MTNVDVQEKGQILAWWSKNNIVLNDDSADMATTDTGLSSLKSPNELVKEIRKKMLNIKSER